MIVLEAWLALLAAVIIWLFIDLIRRAIHESKIKHEERREIIEWLLQQFYADRARAQKARFDCDYTRVQAKMLQKLISEKNSSRKV